MIFLTVGTQLPFDRLVRAVDAWAAANTETPVFGQIADPGPNGYRPTAMEWAPFVSPEEIERRFRESRAIVAHAGMGSIISAMTHAKPLLIMPRRGHLGEHRNDHQFATVEAFGSKPGVRVALEEGDVAAALDALVAAPASDGATSDAGLASDAGSASIAPTAEPRLIEALSAFIHQGKA